MARPTRAKVASAHPRVASDSPAAGENANPPEALPPRRNPPRKGPSSRSDDAAVSDSSEVGCVSKARAARAQRQDPSQDLTMTGALGPDDVAGAHVELQRKNKEERQRRLKERQAQWAKDRAERETRRRQDGEETTAGQQEEDEPQQDDARSSSPEVSRRARQATAANTRAPAVKGAGAKPVATPSDANEDEPSLPHDNADLPGESTLLADTTLTASSPQSIRRPASALKARATPGQESSLLNLKQFKRRPRQPSIARMVQQSTLGDTSRLDFDDFDDFTPDYESTPLNTKTGAAPAGVDISGKKSHGGSEASGVSSGSQKRKLDENGSEIQVLRSSPPVTSSPIWARQVSPVSSEVSLPPSSPPESSLMEERIEETQTNNEDRSHQQPMDLNSETMAPPRSSSVPVDDELYADPESPQANKKRRTNGTATDSEEGQVSRRTRGRAKRTVEEVNTKVLQSLLPKRRLNQLKRSEYDVPSTSTSSEAPDADSDEDELQRSTLPARQTRNKKSASKAPASKTATASINKQGMRGRTTRRATSPVTAPASKVQNGRVRKTYGRRRASDKSNESSGLQRDDGSEAENDVEGSSHMSATAKAKSKGRIVSKELEAAAKKFKEIDEYEMAFEELTDEIGGRSSSPQYR